MFPHSHRPSLATGLAAAKAYMFDNVLAPCSSLLVLWVPWQQQARQTSMGGVACGQRTLIPAMAWAAVGTSALTLATTGFDHSLHCQPHSNHDVKGIKKANLVFHPRTKVPCSLPSL